MCVCVYVSSFATAIVLLSKLSGREENLNVYLTWLWLIPNWAYSTLLPFLCLCVSFIYHAAGSLKKTNLFLFFMHNNLQLPLQCCSRLHAERTSLDLRPSPCPPHHNFTQMTFEPCAELRREKAWKIFIT